MIVERLFEILFTDFKILTVQALQLTIRIPSADNTAAVDLHAQFRNHCMRFRHIIIIAQTFFIKFSLKRL